MGGARERRTRKTTGKRVERKGDVSTESQKAQDKRMEGEEAGRRSGETEKEGRKETTGIPDDAQKDEDQKEGNGWRLFWVTITVVQETRIEYEHA